MRGILFGIKKYLQKDEWTSTLKLNVEKTLRGDLGMRRCFSPHWRSTTMQKHRNRTAVEGVAVVFRAGPVLFPICWFRTSFLDGSCTQYNTGICVAGALLNASVVPVTGLTTLQRPHQGEFTSRRHFSSITILNFNARSPAWRWSGWVCAVFSSIISIDKQY